MDREETPRAKMHSARSRWQGLGVATQAPRERKPVSAKEPGLFIFGSPVFLRLPALSLFWFISIPARIGVPSLNRLAT
jgi:hypothetical protein